MFLIQNLSFLALILYLNLRSNFFSFQVMKGICFLFKICFRVIYHMEMDYSSSDDKLTDQIFKWKCMFCLKWAKDGTHLEFQYLSECQSVYFDINGIPWVCCDVCYFKFHLRCITKRTVLEMAKSRFICSHFCCQSK